jgi:hypothetical protein
MANDGVHVLTVYQPREGLGSYDPLVLAKAIAEQMNDHGFGCYPEME